MSHDYAVGFLSVFHVLCIWLMEDHLSDNASSNEWHQQKGQVEAVKNRHIYVIV
jgi:hypothetical protein